MENVYKFACNLVSLFVSHSLPLFFFFVGQPPGSRCHFVVLPLTF